MLEFLKETGDVLSLTPSGDPAIPQVVLSRLPRPYRTSRYAADDDMIIGLVIRHHQLIPQVCFITVSYSHHIVYIKKSEV